MNESGMYNQMEELFRYWKSKQEAESEESLKKTLPKPPKGKSLENGFRGSFCWDGMTSLNGDVHTDDSKVEVLFILREANTEGKPELRDTLDTFWFNNADKRKDTPYEKAIMRALAVIYGEKEEQLRDKHFGYMNLNKRGGFGETNLTQLKHYVKRYKNLIREQIELFQPTYVVCFGVYGTVKDMLPDCVKVTLDCYHPANRSTEDFHIKQIFGNSKMCSSILNRWEKLS